MSYCTVYWKLCKDESHTGMNTDIERITASVRFHMTSAIISLVSTVESANVYMSCFHYWKLNTQHTLNRAHVKPRTRQTAHTPNHAHTTPLPHRWPADHILLLSLTAHRYLLGQSVGITDRGSESPMGRLSYETLLLFKSFFSVLQILYPHPHSAVPLIFDSVFL